MCAQDNLWGVSSVSQSEGRHNDLHAYTCPQGYCHCTMATITNSDQCSSLFQTNNSDAQCACYRTGNGKVLLNIVRPLQGDFIGIIKLYTLDFFCYVHLLGHSAHQHTLCVRLLSVQATCVVPAPMELV